MEIDFLGLKSPRYDIGHEGSNNVFTDAANGGVETSLSLSTSSSLDSHKEILNFSENKKKKWEFGGNSDRMIPSCSGSGSSMVYSLNHENSNKVEQHSLLLMATPFFHRPSATGFVYDFNDAAAASSGFRNIDISPTSLPMQQLYPPSPNLFNQPQKTETNMYIAGNASTGLLRSGYTPTVAMARRATLARFLEKRLHRMNQVRTSHVMGRSVNGTNSETRESSITKSNKKKKNNLLKRS